MTYNQVIDRLELLALSHKQLNSFFRGLWTDFTDDENRKYACCVVSDAPFIFNATDRLINLGFRIYFADLMDLSMRAKVNEQDVQSDMLNVAGDYIALLNAPAYEYDWTIGAISPGEILSEEQPDYVAGVYIDVVIGLDFLSDACQVPNDEVTFPEIDNMKYVYDLTYPATGDEGTELDTSAIAELADLTGKKILLITKEYSPMYLAPDSNNIQSDEYTWNNTVIGLSLPTLPGMRFHFIYRNY